MFSFDLNSFCKVGKKGKREVVSPSFRTNNFTVKVKKKIPSTICFKLRGTMASIVTVGQEGYRIGRDCDWLTSKL